MLCMVQMHGFTCGVDDLLVMPSKDTKMKEQLESCEEIGEKVFRDFIEVEDDKRKGMPLFCSKHFSVKNIYRLMIVRLLYNVRDLGSLDKCFHSLPSQNVLIFFVPPSSSLF